MQLLGFEVLLPDGLRLEKESRSVGGVCIDLIGEGGQALIASIVEKGLGVGFSVSSQRAERVELERDEQYVILVFHPSGLTIQTYDPTVFPAARQEETAVVLADLRVDMGSASITPLRERRSGDLSMAAWKLRGVTAQDAVRRVLEEAVNGKGLRRGPTYAPPEGGRETWRGEASSKLELVKVRATVEFDHVLLEIEHVDKRTQD
jgi:hypothetical protein